MNNWQIHVVAQKHFPHYCVTIWRTGGVWLATSGEISPAESARELREIADWLEQVQEETETA